MSLCRKVFGDTFKARVIYDTSSLSPQSQWGGAQTLATHIFSCNTLYKNNNSSPQSPPPQYFRKYCFCLTAVLFWYLKHLMSCLQQKYIAFHHS